MLGGAKHPRAIIALCVITVIAIAAVAIFEASGGAAPVLANPTDQIDDDYSAHLVNVHSMNISAIEQDYASDASIDFLVPGVQNSGNYTGLKEIGIGYNAAMYPNFALPLFSQRNSTLKIDGSKATIDSTFLIQGYDSDANAQSAGVTAHVVYVRQGSTWLISFETWSFNLPPGTGDAVSEDG